MNAIDQDTASVSAARTHARSQADESSKWMPYVPASSSPYAPTDIDRSELTWAETVAPGGYTHRVVARGTRIRFEDVTGDACAHLLIHNALEPWERLNVADTQKIPWQAYLGEGHPLLSGEGRVLATVVGDTSGHHDAFCGTSSELWNARKYGQSSCEGAYPAGRSLFTLAGAKHGLTPRDLPPSVSFFQGQRIAGDGSFVWTGSAGPSATVDLLAELPLIVLVANVPHPLDPRPDYVVGALRVHAWRSRSTTATDHRFDASPERRRAYLNTIDYAEARGL